MSTAVRQGLFFGETVRVGDSLPVIVKDRKKRNFEGIVDETGGRRSIDRRRRHSFVGV